MQFPCADALSYSHFAEGKLDIVIQCGNRIWDIHALIPIIKAARGIVTTWKNDDAKKFDHLTPIEALAKRINKLNSLIFIHKICDNNCRDKTDKCTSVCASA